ncbi:hypothetical protein N8772_00400 [Rickettsiales bacterium]|nr:hypothetical protein [Rickettsiales bacterium]MDB2550574.1 hypothetical protein [Rickettsiales bacterium]
MKKTTILNPLAIIATTFIISNAHANLPKYGKWCGNLDLKLKAKAIDKIDESCKRNFKCKSKSKTGFERLNCDIDLMRYLDGRGQKYAKTADAKKARAKILSYFEEKSKNWK